MTTSVPSVAMTWMPGPNRGVSTSSRSTLAGGPLAEATGFAGLAVMAFLVALGPAVLALRLAEPVPGQYAQPMAA